MIKKFIKYPATFAVLLVAFSLLLVAVNTIPRSLISSNLHESADTLSRQGDWFNLSNGATGQTTIDNYTNAIMLNIAAHGSDMGVQGAFGNYYISITNGDSSVIDLANTIDTDALDSETQTSYAYYWHGWQVWLKPLLIFFNISQIQFLLFVVMSALIFAVCVLLARLYSPSAGIMFGVSYAVVLYPITCASLSFSITFMLSLIMSIRILTMFQNAGERKKSKHGLSLRQANSSGGTGERGTSSVRLAGSADNTGTPSTSTGSTSARKISSSDEGATEHGRVQRQAACGEVSPKHGWQIELFIVGCATSYLGVLCTPIISVVVPLALLVLLQSKFSVHSSLAQSLKFLVGCLVTWACGYVLMWVSDWVISQIITGMPVISQGINAFFTRSGSTGVISRTDVLAKQVEALLPSKLLIACAAIAIICSAAYIFARKRKQFVQKLPYAIPLLILALLPYVWYMFALNHSGIHYWFTYRSQIVTVMALCFCVLLVFPPKHSREFEQNAYIKANDASRGNLINAES